MEPVFHFNAYRDFLKARIKAHGRRGLLTALASAAGCRSAHLSMVFKGQNELSQDQAYAIGKYLKLKEADLQYFLLLVQSERAATPSFRSHLQELLEEHKRKSLTVSSRIEKTPAPSIAISSRYYSSWEYAAVHILLTIPQYSSAKKVAARLNLSVERVEEVLKFLESAGLAREKNGTYETTQKQIHLTPSSPQISAHHLNWRLKAVQNSLANPERDVHYSSIVSFSRNDLPRLKSKIIEFIRDVKSEVRISKEEEIACFSLDFFVL